MLDIPRAPARWRRCDKDAARPTGTSGVLLILGPEVGPAYLRDSLAPAVSGMRSGLDGRAASSTDQSGGTAGLALLAFAARLGALSRFQVEALLANAAMPNTGPNDVTFRLVLRARSLIPEPAATNK